jgi:hypothetical protein
MTASVPIIEKTIYIYQENHVVRTGLLLYYDPLNMSHLYGSLLSALNTRSDTLPASDPATNLFPSGINAMGIDLETQ